MSGLRVVLAAGGTGGHVYPALALAEEFARLGAGEIRFMGRRGSFEERVVRDAGYGTDFISAGKIRREKNLLLAITENLSLPFSLVVGLFQSLLRLRRFRPHLVVGTGGYVSGPPVYVASWLGIPTVIHEQNMVPGLTTRLLVGRVDQCHVTYPETVGRLKKKAL